MCRLSRHLLAAILLGSGCAVQAADSSTPPEPISFGRDVRPILADKCFPCHGPDENRRKAGMRLDVASGALAILPDSDVPPITPGQPERSGAWRRIYSADADEQMPPPSSHRVLSEAERATITRWIVEGARYESHWAFTPIEAQSAPHVNGLTWCRNEIDRFVLARLEHVAIEPSPEADRATLLRRLSLDLTGLPPTPTEVAAFVASTEPNAYEREVDRLLASQRYGEHMAMQWMDIARYADSDGFQFDRTRSMWPWRDWVARAYNRNLPYDQFVVQQIAGDLLPGATAEETLASGFQRNHMLNGEGGSDREESRVGYVADRTIVTGTAFLGLTLECCRCHDHKFDPLTSRDFYAVSAFFNQIDEDGWVGDEGHRSEIKGGGAEPLLAYETSAWGKQEVMVMRDLPTDKARTTWVLTRGNWDQHGDPVTAAVPAALPQLPSESPPNRLALARWLVSPNNPLVARVEVNRRWQSFFGYGLTRTPGDLGFQGDFPTHPELLDRLAADFMSTGWDVKKLQRAMVCSATYRQSSRQRPELLERDPLNRLLARQSRFRLPAAVLRDQALFASGLLVERVGGPPTFPYQPSGLWEEISNNQLHYKQDEGENLYRRSLYIYWRRLIAPPSLFDVSTRQTCRVNPIRTNTPLQSLALLNDPVFVEAARALAVEVFDAAGFRGETCVARAFERVCGRTPTRADLAPLLACFEKLSAHYEACPGEAMKVLAIGDSKLSPDFAPEYLPKLAALAGTCGVLLNLDETLTRE